MIRKRLEYVKFHADQWINNKFEKSHSNSEAVMRNCLSVVGLVSIPANEHFRHDLNRTQSKDASYVQHTHGCKHTHLS